jgi:hypothetical protein
MGTARFASIHSHLGEELSRRDDLEALCYIMLYFFNGSLPWQSIPCNSKTEKYCKIRNMKQNMNSKELSVNAPPEFRLFVSHCRGLKFEEEPKYKYLRGLLSQVAEKEGYDITDLIFDWEDGDFRTICDYQNR